MWYNEDRLPLPLASFLTLCIANDAPLRSLYSKEEEEGTVNSNHFQLATQKLNFSSLSTGIQLAILSPCATAFQRTITRGGA